MSGIKMTSLFGSIINYAILWFVCKKAKIIPTYVAILGDDVDLSFGHWTDPWMMFAIYDEINFPISKQKSFHQWGFNK
jgi:hypothetical protein